MVMIEESCFLENEAIQAFCILLSFEYHADEVRDPFSDFVVFLGRFQGVVIRFLLLSIALDRVLWVL